MHGVVAEDNQPVVAGGNAVGQQVVRIDARLHEVAAAAAALAILDQRLDIAAFRGGHVAHLEGEEQRVVEAHAILFHGQFGVRPLLPVGDIERHIAAYRQLERIAHLGRTREVMHAPGIGHGQRVEPVEAHAVELRRTLVDGLVDAPRQIVQAHVLFRIADFHMEMRARRRACVAHLGHDVAPLDREFVGCEAQVHAEAFFFKLGLLHPLRDVIAEAVQVAVDRGRPVGMDDVKAVAIAPGAHRHAGDVAALDGVDRIADPAADAPVKAAVEVVVTQFAVGTRKRHRHIERRNRLLLCQCPCTYHKCDQNSRQPLHDFGVNEDEFRQLSITSFSLRSRRLGMYTCT